MICVCAYVEVDWMSMTMREHDGLMHFVCYLFLFVIVLRYTLSLFVCTVYHTNVSM